MILFVKWMASTIISQIFCTIRGYEGVQFWIMYFLLAGAIFALSYHKKE